MKRMILILLVLLLVPVIGSAETSIVCATMQDGVTITASGSDTSGPFDLKRRAGYFSLQIEISGTGTAKIEYLLSNNGTDYIEPATATDIATGVTAANDNEIYSFSPELARYLKIKVTETGGANSVTVTTTLCVQ